MENEMTDMEQKHSDPRSSKFIETTSKRDLKQIKEKFEGRPFLSSWGISEYCSIPKHQMPAQND